MWSRLKDIVVNSIETIAAATGPTEISSVVPFNNARYLIVRSVNNETEARYDDDATAASNSDDTEEPARVSTRARFSYELDRYTKNILLIFEGNASHAITSENQSDDSHQAEDICGKFAQTFIIFGFEVEIHRNMTDEEIANTCDRFFQRDFTEYGCLAVMMLARTRGGIVESKHTPQSEIGVLRYISDLMPVTLQNKPKLYIVQTESFHVIPGARVWSEPAQHILELRLPVPIVSAPDASGKRSKVCCLLEHIYDKINGLADQSDLHTILNDSVNEFRRVWQQYDLPVGFYSSLTKELRLEKSN